MRDMLVHGLVSLGLHVVDVPRPQHLYEDEALVAEGAEGAEGSGALYGSGFTYAGWLPRNDGPNPEADAEASAEAEAEAKVEVEAEAGAEVGAEAMPSPRDSRFRACAQLTSAPTSTGTLRALISARSSRHPFSFPPSL